ncbi:MAG: transcription termination factor NusA [Desulfovibrionaceae bacterium]|nr:transcription termination factor NusA [Desulfovibrionaceae bacterium]
MNLELKKTIDQICKDRGIDKATLIETLEAAVEMSVLRKYGERIDIEVTYDDDTGEIKVFQFKVVVETVQDPDREVTLEQALKLDPGVQLNDEMGFPLKVEDLGRIAAQSAKQVIIQRMHEAEQKSIYDEYVKRVGEIVIGVPQRRDRRNIIVNLNGRAEAILPESEQIPGEHFGRDQRIQAVIKEVRNDGRSPQIVLSRAGREYMIALFKREIPEVDDGIVQIINVARDPGRRAKVAVFSRDRDVDAVGSCVGVRGSRIQNIVQELHGERIDIVVWSSDISVYARNALAPAVVSRIRTVEEDGKTQLEVVVPESQLTGAIGVRGQNTRLAATLLGMKINIIKESDAKIDAFIASAAKVVNLPEDMFEKAGYTSLDRIDAASDDDLGERLGLSAKKIEELRMAINLYRDRPAGNTENAEE